MLLGTDRQILIIIFITIAIEIVPAQYDTTLVQKTIDSLSHTKEKDTLQTNFNNSIFPDSSEIDSLHTLSDSLKKEYNKFYADSQYKMFFKGVNDYKQRRFFEAVETFRELNSIPVDQNRFLLASDMMMIKTYLRMGNVDKALSLGYEFETYYGEDVAYIDDVRYSIARALFKKENYSEALTYYLQVVKNYKDIKLVQKCIQEMETLVDIFMDIEDLEKLHTTFGDMRFFKFYFSLKLAEKYHEKGEENQAEEFLRIADEDSLQSNFIEQKYQEVNRYLEEAQRKRIYVGVILPFTGERKGISNKILTGIKYALNEVRDSKNMDVAGVVMDNKNDFIRTVKQTRFLVQNPRVKAIMGGLTSKNTIGVAAVANQAEIPFISPTATNSRITEIGDWGFQANVDFTYRGRFLGEYCTQQKEINNMVTLSPGGDFGVEITDAFSKTVDKGGIRILTQEWYSGSPEDLSMEFEKIREIGIELEKQKIDEQVERMSDSLNNMILTDSLTQFGDSIKIAPTDTGYIYNKGGKTKSIGPKKAMTKTGLMDSTEIFLPEEMTLDYQITGIDAMFLPVTSQNLDMIISQLDYHNIDARVFGSADWNNLQKLRRNDMLLDSSVFISDHYINRESEKYRRFANGFHSVMGELPERFDIYGYDSIQPILQGIAAGHSSRNELREYLLGMPIYRGVARNISFQGNRPGVNSCAFILSYRNNEIKPIAVIEKGRIVEVK